MHNKEPGARSEEAVEIIHRFRPETEFHTDEGCFIVEMDNAPAGDCSVARARVPVGMTTRRHALHGSTERYVILEGRGMVEVGDKDPILVGPLDVVVIPADVAQRITNTGAKDLVFLCVCTPAFSQERYVDLENSAGGPRR